MFILIPRLYARCVQGDQNHIITIIMIIIIDIYNEMPQTFNPLHAC